MRKLARSSWLLALAAVAFSPALAFADKGYTWSGAYLGGSAGWREVDVDWSFPSPSSSTQATTQSFDTAIGGVHLGYQKQFGSTVLGLEIGLNQAFKQKRESSSCSFPSPFDDRCDTRAIGTMFTFGARAGWTPTSRSLLFVSGGYATAKVDTQIRFGGVGVPPADDATPVTSSRKSHDGWYFGGGAEYMLTPNWIVGFEYLRVELGSEGHCVGGNCGSASILNRNVDLQSDIVRARLTFKLP